tara:strand:- start:556 stop:1563 length:1008 start_codon:yes stop_codon:yes gene_type:complete
MIRDRDAIRAAVGRLPEPKLNWPLEELNLIRELSLEDGKLILRIDLIEPDPGKRSEFRTLVEETLAAFDLRQKIIRINRVDVSRHGLRDVAHIILVGSGKGGVGKSTVSVNIAAELVRQGKQVGILDADIFGPSIPLLLGTAEKPQVLDQEVLLPVSVMGMKLISMGSLMPREKAMAWRGALVSGTILQFLRQVNWGVLDYLIVDLPPGTGDVQMTIAQEIRPEGAIIVTTPHELSRADVQRCLSMFSDYNIPVIGVLENMAAWICGHCGTEQPVFSGPDHIWEDIPLLGRLPLEKEMWESARNGVPYVTQAGGTATARVFARIAGDLISGKASK